MGNKNKNNAGKGVGSNTMKNAVEKAIKPDPKKKVRKNVTGTVKWFDPKRGFGFIVTEDGEQVFAHISGVKSGRTYTGFDDNDKVTFTIVPNEKGPMAKNINLIPDEEEEAEVSEETTEAADPEGEGTTEEEPTADVPEESNEEGTADESSEESVTPKSQMVN